MNNYPRKINLNLNHFLDSHISHLLTKDKLNIGEFFKIEANQNFQKLQSDLDYLSIGGVYIYISNGKIIYIGKAKKLIERLQAHFLEMNELHTNCPIFWQVYFNYYQKRNLDLYIINIENEIEQLAIEHYLQTKLNPEFDIIKNEFKKKLGIKNQRLKPGTKEYLTQKKKIIKFLDENLKF